MPISNRLKNVFLTLLVLLSMQKIAICQVPIGNWEFKVIDKSTYGGGTQNWDFALLPSGEICFANNEGVIISNGSEWNIHPVPNSTIVRSTLFDDQSNRLYLGAQNEFGFLEEDEMGEYA